MESKGKKNSGRDVKVKNGWYAITYDDGEFEWRKLSEFSFNNRAVRSWRLDLDPIPNEEKNASKSLITPNPKSKNKVAEIDEYNEDVSELSENDISDQMSDGDC